MIVVLDTNEYLNFLNNNAPYVSVLFADDKVTIHANEIVIKEVLRNLKEELKKEFFGILFKNNIIIHGEKLPFYLLEKYKNIGLRKGDIEIATFCEHIKADYLITENRHFLKMKKFDKFEVLSLKDFLNKLK